MKTSVAALACAFSLAAAFAAPAAAQTVVRAGDLGISAEYSVKAG